MVIITSFLFPYTDVGILTRIDGDTIYIDGIRPDVDLEQLEAELRNNWEDLFKKELSFCVNDSYVKTIEASRPQNFQDLAVKAQLGILSQEEERILKDYYIYANNLKEEAERLQQMINNSSILQISTVILPEWVKCEFLPINPKFVIRKKEV